MPKDSACPFDVLPVADYCIDCLSRSYEQESSVVRAYLRVNGCVRRDAECGNCGERAEIFRPPPLAPD
jgi:hypothetical protein